MVHWKRAEHEGPQSWKRERQAPQASFSEDTKLCGIAGFTHRKSVPPPERIREVVKTLVHRGPDQQGVHESATVSLCAARLKILDLKAGDQPIRDDTGDYVIVFNGEIYNHLELRAELEARGHRFHSHSDTETVLHAFMEWDTGCFARMRGMFAAALWKESERRLVLGRDRLGIKPLYIARRGEDLYFGSELKAIFAHPEIERRLCREGLDCYLSLNYVPSPWTLAEGIEKVPSGYWMEWRDGKERTEAYWQVPYGPKNGLRIEDAKEELDELLGRAVKEHLLSDVALGVWLSGGIDSSTILHYAAQASGSRLKTFSVSFAGQEFDESPFFRAAAKKYATDHEEFDLNIEAGLTEAISEFAYYSDEPSADAGALPVWFLSRMTKRKVTVVLSGEGGDELFAGYLTYRANELARKGRRLPAGLLGFASRALRHWPASDEKISMEYTLKRLVEGCRMSPERAHVYWNGTFSDEEKRRLMASALPNTLGGALAGLREKLPGDGVAPYLWFDQRNYLQDDILTKSDRMSMAHSLELRPPFLDHRLVEFAAKLPGDFKLRGSRQKFILKELMKDRLPGPILTHKKTGFDIPAHKWLRGALRPLLEETLGDGLAEHEGLFDRAAVNEFVRLHMERRVNLGYHLWGLLILFLWMKRWRIESGAAKETSIAAEKVLAPI
jgi:asparagine synthase (glutamine-hydrolysing)